MKALKNNYIKSTVYWFSYMHDYAWFNDVYPFPLEDHPQEKWTKNVSDEFYLEALIKLYDYLW